MVINFMLIYHFVDPDLGVVRFCEKVGATQKGGIYFEIEDSGTCSTLALQVKENFLQNLSAFSLSFGDKKRIAFKISLDHFVDFDLGIVRFCEKEGVTQKGGIYFEIGDSVTCSTLALRVQENFLQSLSAFSFSFGGKKE